MRELDFNNKVKFIKKCLREEGYSKELIAYLLSIMKWNKPSGYSSFPKWQQTRRGTARARLYYFITQHGTGDGSYCVGYGGFGTQVVMKSAGTFNTAQEARAYCERIDKEAVIIEEQTA
jgi:hypothetical protein